MKAADAFPSNWLKKEDLPSPVSATIRGVTQEQIKGERGNELKPILHFHGSLKPLILNRGNWNTIASMYGDDSTGWPGKVIELYSDPSIMFGSKAVGGIRIRPAPGAAPVSNAEWTYPEALAEAAKAGISKEHIVAKLKAAGMTAWNNAKCTPLVKAMIQEVFNAADQPLETFDAPFADDPAGLIPF